MCFVCVGDELGCFWSGCCFFFIVMFEFLILLYWGVIFQIVIIDILFGGDNVVVIVLVCCNLLVNQWLCGVVWGIVGVILLCVVLIMFVVVLFDVLFLKFGGGLLLLWIGIKLMVLVVDVYDNIKLVDWLWDVVKMIVIVDVVMSFDNVIVIVGVVEQVDLLYWIVFVIFGFVVSVLIIVWGSMLVLKLFDCFLVVVVFGVGLFGWIVGGLIVNDLVGDCWLVFDMLLVVYGVSIVGVLFVVVIGYVFRKCCSVLYVY